MTARSPGEVGGNTTYGKDVGAQEMPRWDAHESLGEACSTPRSLMRRVSGFIDLRLEIAELQDLLAEGMCISAALDRMRMVRGEALGWKDYQKYAPLIYSDPRILIPVEKGFLREHAKAAPVNDLRMVLNEVAKWAASELLKRKALMKAENYGKEWPNLCRDIVKAWIHEVALDLVGSGVGVK